MQRSHRHENLMGVPFFVHKYAKVCFSTFISSYCSDFIYSSHRSYFLSTPLLQSFVFILLLFLLFSHTAWFYGDRIIHLYMTKLEVTPILIIFVYLFSFFFFFRFASRQDQTHPETWLSSKATCPLCRSHFCMLDVCQVQPM